MTPSLVGAVPTPVPIPPMDPVAEQLHEERKERLQLRARSRHFYVALASGAVVLVVSLALALTHQPVRIDLDATAAVIAAYVALWHVEFEVGPVTVSPVQAAAVAMWFVVDPAGLPLTIVTAQVLAFLVRGLHRRAGVARTARGLVFSVADASFILGPTIVLLALAPTEPGLSSAWIFLLALGAQFAFDVLVTTIRAKLAGGSLMPLSDWRWLWSIDAALAPLGVAIAVATSTNDAAPLALLPLAAILGQFARERDERIQHALELSSAYRGTARLMGDVLEADDAYTGGEHTQGVVGLALALGEAVGLDPRQMRDLEFGALLHDIGKLRVPNEIINKPGKLNDEEWAIIKRHPATGRRCSTASAANSARPASSSARTTSAGMAAATRTASSPRRFRSRRASSRSATATAR